MGWVFLAPKPHKCPLPRWWIWAPIHERSVWRCDGCGRTWEWYEGDWSITAVRQP